MIGTQWTLLVLIPVTLACVHARWVHYGGVIVLFGVEFWHYARYSIN